MKVAFYAPDGAGDKLLVAAVMGGAARHGDEVIFVPVNEYAGVVSDADVAACYGVRASTRIILDAYRRAGKRTLFFDKGYWGRGVYTRVAVDAWQPTKYLKRGCPRDRLDKTGLLIRPIRADTNSDVVIYAGTTQTWHDFCDLGPARALDELIIGLLSWQSYHPVVYRPRPAYAKKHPELCQSIKGAELSTLSLDEDLARCRVLVTLGSNVAIDALAAGVPAHVLGDHPCQIFRDYSTRIEFFADLSYCHWTLDEYHSGEAWADIKSVMGAA